MFWLSLSLFERRTQRSSRCRLQCLCTRQYQIGHATPTRQRRRINIDDILGPELEVLCQCKRHRGMGIKAIDDGSHICGVAHDINMPALTTELIQSADAA